MHLSQIDKNIKKAGRESIIAANDYRLFVEVFPGNDLEVLSSIGFILSFRIMLKHFKMYITMNDIIAEKRIDLPYPIRRKEVAIVSMFSENIHYKFMEPWTIELGSRDKKVLAELAQGEN